MTKSYNAVIKSKLERREIPGFSNTGGPYEFEVEINENQENKKITIITETISFQKLKDIIIPETKCEIEVEVKEGIYYLNNITVK